jgi:roadblock/LC7 domain-containing protein
MPFVIVHMGTALAMLVVLRLWRLFPRTTDDGAMMHLGELEDGALYMGGSINAAAICILLLVFADNYAYLYGFKWWPVVQLNWSLRMSQWAPPRTVSAWIYFVNMLL